MKKSPFSLIELIIVIAIIAVLTIMVIPKFTNLEGEAKEASDRHNMSETLRMVQNFHSANGKYPARLHTGMCDDGSTLVKMISGFDNNGYGLETSTDAMKGALAYNMTNTVALPADDGNNKYRESLAKAGIAYLCQGYNRGYTDRTRDASRTNPRYIVNDWYKGTNDDHFNSSLATTDSANIIRVRGQSLEQWTHYSYDDNGSSVRAESDYYRIVPLFVSRMTEWDKVYDENGQVISTSKLGISIPARSPYGEKETFAFYTALFLAYKDGRAAELLSMISPSGDCLEASAY